MKRFIFAVIVMTMLVASSLVACGGGSCLDEFPCNAGDDDDSDGSSYDGAADVEIVDASTTDSIDDMSTIDSSTIDAEPDGSDAADD